MCCSSPLGQIEDPVPVSTIGPVHWNTTDVTSYDKTESTFWQLMCISIGQQIGSYFIFKLTDSESLLLKQMSLRINVEAGIKPNHEKTK